MTQERNCGVLLHISSLPSPYGIGNLGKSAYDFVDFLARAGQVYWQILPTCPTSYGDSPYQSPSAFAGNPYFIDLDDLVRRGLLTRKEANAEKFDAPRVDYGRLFATREKVLRAAFARFNRRESAYIEFCENNAAWLDTYALFAACKKHTGYRPHWEWGNLCRYDSDAVREFAAAAKEETDYYRFEQYIFDAQWHALHAYAGEKGVRIIGDTPIYVAYDSADFWANPRLFFVDEDCRPAEVAGVPPDYFSSEGQLWGNPLYDWQAMREDGYRFWIERIRRNMALYDMLRIDHFRGFESYYAVPKGAATAREGGWRKGPGKELFDAVHAALGCENILAEDLGVESEAVQALVRDCGFPGMKVVQFGFDGNPGNPHIPRNYTSASFGYTGTHDNDTALGWFASLSPDARRWIRCRLPRKVGDISRAVICALYASRARTAIVPIQDWLHLGSEARMNTPGTNGGNWQFRLPAVPDTSLADEMAEIAKTYDRTRCQPR